MTTALKRLFSLPPRTIRRRTRALGVLLTAALPIGLLCACASAGSSAQQAMEPIALRPNPADKTSVTATGTLTTPAGISPDTRIRFTPTVLADDAFEIDVRIAMPETHPLLSSTIPLDDIVAHIVFAAE